MCGHDAAGSLWEQWHFLHISLPGCPLCLTEGGLQITVSTESVWQMNRQNTWNLINSRRRVTVPVCETLSCWVSGTGGHPTVCAGSPNAAPWGSNSATGNDSCASEQPLFSFSEIKMSFRYRWRMQRLRKKCVSGILWYQSPVARLFNRIPLMSSRRISASKVTVSIACLWDELISYLESI